MQEVSLQPQILKCLKTRFDLMADFPPLPNQPPIFKALFLIRLYKALEQLFIGTYRPKCLLLLLLLLLRKKYALEFLNIGFEFRQVFLMHSEVGRRP